MTEALRRSAVMHFGISYGVYLSARTARDDKVVIPTAASTLDPETHVNLKVTTLKHLLDSLHRKVALG